MVYTQVAKNTEILKEGEDEILKINYEAVSYIPSIEENHLVMLDAIEKLAENPSISRLIFSQRRNYNYSYEETQLLIEIANIYNYFVRSKKATSLQNFGLPSDSPQVLGQRFDPLRYIFFSLLKSDPLGAYVELKRLIRKNNIILKSYTDINQKKSLQVYLDLLNQIFEQFDKTQLINLAREFLPGYTFGNREVYKLFFKPSITPDFMYTKLITSPPLDGKQLSIYKINPNTDVTVFDLKDDIKKFYQINPPEFKISEDKYEILELARKVLAEHQPRDEEFLDPHKMRKTFTNIGKGMIQELAEQKGMLLSPEEIENLTEILVRHTIGFGVIELLLEDPNVQDLTINSPMGQVPIFLLHNDHNECTTNITPTKNDFESWATKLRLLSGRPLDEANPILDTEVVLPKARSRLSIIGKPLNPYGYGMSFRRHRDKPWTLPLFIENKMISPLGAGLLSFTIHGSRTHLVAGTRSSGKTSFLGSTLLEIMRKYRILTVEDSVTEDCEMLIKQNGLIKRRRIGDLVNEQIENYQAWYNLSEHEICGNPLNIEVLSMTKDGKINFSKVSKFIRHKVKKDIFEVRTSTGRIIKVTGDHSLFTLGSDADIVEIKTGELKQGDYIASPREYINNNLSISKLFITQFPSHMSKLYFRGENIKEFLKKHKFEVKQLAKEHGYKKAQRNKWFRLGLIPGKILSDLHSLNINISNLKGIEWKCGHNSFWMPIKIKLDKDFLTLIGLWLADGCYDKNSIIFSVSTNEERNVIKRFAKKWGIKPKIHSSDGISTLLHSKTLKFLFREILEFKGNAFTKRVPSWIYNLSKAQIACILCGLFSGDGCVSNKEIVISLNSRKLMEDIQTLLLQFGIIFRIRKISKNSNSYPGAISTIRDFNLFKEHIDLLQEYKKDNLRNLCLKTSTHDSSDIIPLSLEFKKKLKVLNKNFNSRDYINSNSNIGRTKLGFMTQLFSSDLIILSKLKSLSESNIFWDKIVEIKKLKNEEQFVYDLSVPSNESFVCNNIVAHNTLELPTESMRELGYNVQPLKVRSALVKGGTEVPADEGIRTSLRLGDSALIVGEVRSTEAVALYEAMRIGASANVVAGTIHGDSPYGIYDRVVNDLGVPKTSFKATDIIVMCSPIQSASGLSKMRRVTSITEVRKTWEDDPLQEGGFVDLMKYNAKTDLLEPTPDLINGDSEVLKAIGGSVKEWVGNWDAIWDNIKLRAEIKSLLVDYSKKINNKDILEAQFSLKSNEKFYRISDEVKQEVGTQDTKLIKERWEAWLKEELKNQ